MKKSIIITIALILIIISVISINTLTNQDIKDDSYKEYFSKAYKFEDTSNQYYPEDTIFYENKDIGSYLMKEELSTNTHSVVLYENTRSHQLYKDRIYCIINDNQVVSINLDGMDLKYIYKDDEKISDLYVNDELLFFTKNNSIYRYYIPSETLDLLCTVNNMSYYEPLSNIEVIFYILKIDLLPEHGISQEEQDSLYDDYIGLKYNSNTEKFEMYVKEIIWD